MTRFIVFIVLFAVFLGLFSVLYVHTHTRESVTLKQPKEVKEKSAAEKAKTLPFRPHWITEDYLVKKYDYPFSMVEHGFLRFEELEPFIKSQILAYETANEASLNDIRDLLISAFEELLHHPRYRVQSLDLALRVVKIAKRRDDTYILFSLLKFLKENKAYSFELAPCLEDLASRYSELASHHPSSSNQWTILSAVSDDALSTLGHLRTYSEIGRNQDQVYDRQEILQLSENLLRTGNADGTIDPVPSPHDDPDNSYAPILEKLRKYPRTASHRIEELLYELSQCSYLPKEALRYFEQARCVYDGRVPSERWSEALAERQKLRLWSPIDRKLHVIP